MEQPIVNPANPYVGNLRIFPGTLVKIAGRPRPNATRFAINFQTGPSINPRDDLALHLSPCFTPPRVVRNSLVNGQWGLEESWGNGTVINPHAPFEIMVLAEHEQFKVAVNGGHYCEYRHRIPYQQITHLTIDGDLDIDRISVISADVSPQPTAHYQHHQQPTAPPNAPPSQSAPYPMGPTAGMPMPPMYPNLAPQPMAPSHYPSVPSGMPSGPMPGPMPTPSSYGSGGFPSQPGPPHYGGGPQYPQAAPMGGPPPAPSGYHQGGYPQQPHPQQHQQQPGSSSTSTPFGNLPINGKALGAIAGLGLGAAALSSLNPLKKVKKLMKPHKALKAKGKWGRSNSSSSSSSSDSSGSNSSRGSFSSNSS